MTASDIPAPCDLMIIGGRVLALEEDSGELPGAAVAIDDGVIVAVGDTAEVEARWRPARRIDATGHVVAPGFVDAHVHLGAFLFAGRGYQRADRPSAFSGGGREEVVLPMVVRFCSMPADPSLACAAVRPALAAMLRAGFTGVVDAGGPGVEGVVRAAAELGIRAAVGPSIADVWHGPDGEPHRQADPDQLLKAAQAFVDRHDRAGDGRVRALVSGVETTACSDELLAGIAELGEDRDIPIHLHTNILPAPPDAPSSRYHGVPSIERLGRAGLLTQRFTAMHAGSLTDEEVATLARAGVTVNHNPGGNAMLGFGITAGRAVPRLLAADVPVVLGSDTAPSAVQTPFELIRSALMLHREVAGDDSALTLEQALAMSADGGASLGVPGRLGRVAVGQLADLVLVDTGGAHHLAGEHPVPALALQARPGDVQTVIVAGRVVVECGQLVGVDEAELRAAAHRATSVPLTPARAARRPA